MIGNIVESPRILFSKEEFPFQGVMYTKVLYNTINYHDHVINWVLIDDGSFLNIFPFSTLIQLGYELGKIFQNYVNVWAFDGGQGDTIGEVELYI